MAITTRLLDAAMALTVVLLAAPPAAYAQQLERGYVGASFGAQRVNADAVDGSTSAFGVTAGIRLTRVIGLEVEVGRPSGFFSKEYTGTSLSFASPARPGKRSSACSCF